MGDEQATDGVLGTTGDCVLDNDCISGNAEHFEAPSSFTALCWQDTTSLCPVLARHPEQVLVGICTQET